MLVTTGMTRLRYSYMIFTTLLTSTGLTKNMYILYMDHIWWVRWSKCHVRLSRIFVGAFGWKKFIFQCMAWQPIHCEFVTGQCILPEREYVWQGPQVISASSPKPFLKETYFWDNFDYNVRCYDFGYQENLDANFGRGWCIRPKWWIPALILAFHAASLWMQYEDVDTNNMHANLGGGFKYLLFSSLFGEHSHFE